MLLFFILSWINICKMLWTGQALFKYHILVIVIMDTVVDLNFRVPRYDVLK